MKTAITIIIMYVFKTLFKDAGCQQFAGFHRGRQTIKLFTTKEKKREGTERLNLCDYFYQVVVSLPSISPQQRFFKIKSAF